MHRSGGDRTKKPYSFFLFFYFIFVFVLYNFNGHKPCHGFSTMRNALCIKSSSSAVVVHLFALSVYFSHLDDGHCSEIGLLTIFDCPLQMPQVARVT